ncbi:RNA polymerase sigma-70 factor [Pedobacter foliorum]|uniref:RNA polymerase sigma-70 factor n=1 Tax=Pedobacter foliorum TaxID=2739058 RepID=UPI0015640A02|nr:RNA polymerase sigma-70 factor [Pedobacter foliorum]NRF38340.1 RNA polymerase sigma-70 factor [Pedobacter foliorum]
MIFKGLPDRTLIDHCKEGNDKAFNELFRRYFNKLYQFSLKYVKDESIAEGLVLDLLLKIWQKSDEIRTDGEIAPYLFSAMKNTLFNHIRKRQEVTVPLDLVSECVMKSSSPAEDFEAKELQFAYSNTLTQLSPQRKKVFVMSREMDMNHKEIAAELKLSLNTVENHISASIKFLRRELQKHTDIALLLAICFFL